MSSVNSPMWNAIAAPNSSGVHACASRRLTSSSASGMRYSLQQEPETWQSQFCTTGSALTGSGMAGTNEGRVGTPSL